ncbi:hypothetical protein Tsubulata_010759, partial [Turnera subulata]
NRTKPAGFTTLPPGKMGWPFIGETLEFAMSSRRGAPGKFVNDRMSKYSGEVFKTSLLGEDMAVFCGASGNKFLFSKENKYVTSWWPKPFEKILLSEQSIGKSPQKFKDLRHNFLHDSLKPDALQEYIPIMDSTAKQHLLEDWVPNKQVKVFPLAKQYTFALACSLFMSIKDPDQLNRFLKPFKAVLAGLYSVPINFPGTTYNRAIKNGKRIREELVGIIRQRRRELLENEVITKIDILTRLLQVSQYCDNEICDRIMGLLVAGYGATSTATTFTLKFIVEYPHVYDLVFKEQMEIAKSKQAGELLNWRDIQKMKYSWCVACEAMRLLPPVQGTFRETVTDFTYEGYTIPKGWKTHWSAYTTHKNPKYFPDPEKFDPSRFEGNGPVPFSFVPFGGGPRMCPGKEYARLHILVFIHNVVTKFKLRMVNPDEKILYNPEPYPEEGLPNRTKAAGSFTLPPGRKGWPFIGETLEFVMAGRGGAPEKFVKDRMSKYSGEVFKTSLLGEDMVVFCGAPWNKFLFSKENKYVTSWWPKSVEKILLSEESIGKSPQKFKDLRDSFLHEFLKPDALQEYIPIMDSMAKQHLQENWVPNKEVKVYPLTKQYSFALACSLFMSIKDPDQLNTVSLLFKEVLDGLYSVPINFPGTTYSRAIKKGKRIREELVGIIKQRRRELLENEVTTKIDDILARLLQVSEFSDNEICDRIVGLLVAAHGTTSKATTISLKFIIEYPHVYDLVFKEQMEIAKSKQAGELLDWQDIQKMKYSWCVACEAMRLVPPAEGAYREAITDFTYEGFTIPKGWKIHWSVYTTQKNPKYFPDPEKFDPSRFEGNGPIPYSFVAFGGGPRMCPGKEYARLHILIFIHNVVTKFKLRMVNPDEKILYSPEPYPEDGLPVRLESPGN